MQLVKDGPDLPEEVLAAHEAGDLIFFCGAGVSVPAGLPLFKGLVERVYNKLNCERNELEQREFNARNYDRVLGLLENRLIAGSVREAVTGLLETDPNANDLSNHLSILELARDPDGKTRLVTTNFDNAFVQAGSGDLRTYDAPNLPSAKKYRWNGIVHLHGRIRETDDPGGEDLVLTSADFGRAYLTERWASFFLTELFRRFTVLFVGYSVGDPVVRYIIDALAADKEHGEAIREPFVLDGYRANQKEETQQEWEARGLNPIVFPSNDDYRLLYQTLNAWAGMYKDGLLGGKENVIRHHAHKVPRKPYSHEVSQVLSAIKEPSGHLARKFCQLQEPAPIEWLGIFEEEGLLRLPPSFQDLDASVPAGGDDCRSMPGRALSPVTRALMGWLARHLSQDAAIRWAVEHRGQLHPETRAAVRRGLKEQGSALPEVKRKLWQIMSSEAYSCSGAKHSAGYELLERLKKANWDSELKREFLRLVEPCFEIRPPFAMPGEEESESMRSYADVQVTIPLGSLTDWMYTKFPAVPGWEQTLTDIAQELTVLLKQALQMFEWIGHANRQYDPTYLDQPSITPHHQNSRFRPWTALIELVRDAWDAVAARDSNDARTIARSWPIRSYPVFRRLRMYAATRRVDIFPLEESVDLLLEDSGWWLWSTCTQRETYQLLKALWPKLDHGGTNRLLEAVIDGPPRRMFRDDIAQSEWKRLRDSETWRHLAKLDASGRKLPAKAERVFKDLSASYTDLTLSDDESDEFATWVGPARWGWPPELTRPSGQLLSLERSEIASKVASDTSRNLESEWAELVRRTPVRALMVLVHLARDDCWPSYAWSGLVRGLGLGPRKSQFWRIFVSTLLRAPQPLLEELLRPLATWLRECSKSLPSNRQEELWELWDRLMAVAPSEHISPYESKDALERALNCAAGDLATFLLDRVFERKLKPKSGLSEDAVERATGICGGTSRAHALGRVILASRLYYLHLLDPSWTERNLLPYFDWDHAEAAAVWNGYLWQPTMYPDLFVKLKGNFFEALKHREGFHERRVKNIGGFFALICIQARQLLTRVEKANGMGVLDADGRAGAAFQIQRLVENAQSKASTLWKDRIEKFIREAWPKEKDKIEPNSAHSLVLAAIMSREAFPDAVSTVEPLLCPVDFASYVAVRLCEAGHAKNFPEPSLRLLLAIHSKAEQSPHPKFREALQQIQNAWPEGTNDPRFKKLDDYLRGMGG